MSDHLEKPCFFNGKYLALKDANVNIQTHALQYGTACFGGVRAYYNNEKKKLFLFRPVDHYARLHKSAKLMQMSLPHSVDELVAINKKLLIDGGWQQNVYMRPLVYKSALELSPRLHNVEDGFALYVLPLDDYLDTQKGISACVSSWVRIHDNQISPRAKATGGYINSALAKSEALQNGFDEGIFLDSQGNVAEGSAAIIFLVSNDKLITPDLNSSNLDSITRRSVITLANDMNIEVEERKVNRSELYLADEVFFAGTGVQIAWINQIDHRTIGSDKIGPITEKLQARFFQVVRGEDKDYLNWVDEVKP